MNQTYFISQTLAAASWPLAASDLRLEFKKKGGAGTAYAVYTNAPTQPQFAQAHGLSIAREKRNTHGVRTNG